LIKFLDGLPCECRIHKTYFYIDRGIFGDIQMPVVHNDHSNWRVLRTICFGVSIILSFAGFCAITYREFFIGGLFGASMMGLINPSNKTNPLFTMIALRFDRDLEEDFFHT